MTPVPRPTHKARGDLATIALQPDAYETTAAILRDLRGYIVTVIPYDTPPYDAELSGIVEGEDGQYKAVFAPWYEDRDSYDRQNLRTLDIYDELDRIEVF